MRTQQVLLLVALAAVALIGTGANGGITSSYRRKLDATADMPLDADVFKPPPGYNAPEQARFSADFFSFLYDSSL
jgi:hypothetical protein